jgi:hypothetical protein
MTAKRLSSLTLTAIPSGGLALWVSFGALGVADANAGGWRVGVLPSFWHLAASIVLVAMVLTLLLVLWHEVRAVFGL